MELTANWAELLWPGLKTVYGIEYRDYPEQYPQMFGVQTSDKAYEQTLGMTGFGLAVHKPEGQGIAYDEAFQGFKGTLTHSTMGLGFIVTAEMYEDDQYGKINALPKALARSIRHTIEINAANVFNRAFTSTFTGADGKELCATDHPLRGGGTFSNELSTPADFCMTSLEQMLWLIGDMVDDRGLSIYAQPLKLIAHPYNQWNVQTILNSEKWPEDNSNAINPAKGTFREAPVFNPYLTDPDAWFIKTDVPNGMVFYWRRRPKFTRDNDHDTDNAKQKTTYRCSQGWDDPRCIVGTPGGGS